MDEGESRTGYWLQNDEHRIIIYALVSLALLVGGHRTWQGYNRYHESAVRRARIMKLVESSRREKERVLESSGLVASSSTTADVDQAKHAVVAAEEEAEKTLQISATSSSQAQPLTGSTAKRTKERRKRGRDVYKEVLKQERKRGKAPSRDSSAASASSATFPTTTSAESPEDFRAQYQHAPVAGPSSISSTSRSRSRSISRGPINSEDYESTEETPRLSQEEWSTSHASEETVDSSSLSTPHIDAVRQRPFTEDDPSDNGNAGAVKDPCAVALPPTPPPPDLPDADSSMSNSSESVSSRSQSVASSPAPSILQLSNDGGPSYSSSYVSEPIPISQPTPAGPFIKSQAPWLEGNGNNARPNRPRVNNHKNRPPPSSASTLSLATSEGSIDIESPFPSPGRYRQSKSPPPRFRSKSRASMASPLPTMTQIHPSAVTPPPAPVNAPLHAQIASYKGALEAARRREEAARLREENARRELEHFKSECEGLRIRWKEDADRRLATEAELRTELYFLKSQFTGMPVAPGANAGPSQLPPFLPQAQPNHQQNHNGPQPVPHGAAFPLPQLFPFGYPPPMPNQSHGFPGPASPPPHPPFAFPFVASNGVPLMHVLNNLHPSAPNSAGQSPNVLSPTHDFASMAATAFMSSPSSSNMHDDNFQGSDDVVNEELAEAILKRPESLRSPSSFGPTSRSASVAGRATKDGFTFASLSELGNPQAYRAAQEYNDSQSSKGSPVNADEQSGSSPQLLSENVDLQRKSDLSDEEPINDASSTPRTVDDTGGDK